MGLYLAPHLPLTPSSVPGPYRVADYFGYEREERFELIQGWLYEMTSPALLHQIVLEKLGRLLGDLAEATGGRLLPASMDVVLADHSVVQPDLVSISKERLAIVGDRIYGAPDLLVEILSPGSGRRDRTIKRLLYSESGVLEYWIVDPAEEQIDCYVLAAGRYEVVEMKEASFTSPTRSEVTFPVEAFWDYVDERRS